MSDVVEPERWYVVHPRAGILSFSKYGWNGQYTTAKASSFKDEKGARATLRRFLKHRDPPPADSVVVQGREAARTYLPPPYGTGTAPGVEPLFPPKPG